MKYFCKLIFMVVLSGAASSSFATVLYNLDFAPNDIGTYQTVFGNPSVQSSVGPFANALVFQANDYQQIELPIGTAGPDYNIQYDVMTHNLLNSQYGFRIFLDTPYVRTVGLDGGQNNIQVYQNSPYTAEGLMNFSDDQVYHFEITVDLQANLWTVSVDGAQLFSNPFNAASGLEDIRFSLDSVIAPAEPGTYVALDNVVVVNAAPEPSTVCLLLAVGLPVLFLHWRKRQATPAA